MCLSHYPESALYGPVKALPRKRRTPINQQESNWLPPPEFLVLDPATGAIGLVSNFHVFFAVVMGPELRYGPGWDTNRFWDTPFNKHYESMPEVGLLSSSGEWSWEAN